MIWVTILLLVAGLVTLGLQGGFNHVSRVGAAVACVWLGFLIGLPLARRRRWYTRLAFVLVGLAGAVACWLFVPTTGGVSWMEAERRLAGIKSLPVGELDRFGREARDRKVLAAEFPRLKPEIQELEMTWLRQTAARGVEKAEAERADNPAKALRLLRELDAALRHSEYYPQVSASVHEARRRAMQARINEGEAELVALVDKKRYSAVADAGARLLSEVGQEAGELGVEGEARQKVQAVRLRAARAHLSLAEDTLKGLCERRRYADVPKEARRFSADLRGEATALGIVGEVDRRLTPLRRKALEARVAGVRGDMEAHFARADFAAVAELAEEARGELGDEAEAIGLGKLPYTALDGVRTKAARERIENARRHLEELLQAGKLAEVAAAGERAEAELRPEANKTACQGLLVSKLHGVRRRALLARLEQARGEFRALLVKDRYTAIEELALSVATDLRPEAGVVNARAEVDKFCNGCRAVADLARKAGKGGPK
jgi:hypothetical protein